MTITSLNIADGSVKRTRFPQIKKRYVCIGAVLVIICVCLGLSYHYGVFTKKSTELSPPNPLRQLPPSASTLHAFKKAAVCADGPACAKIGKGILEKGGSAVDATIATMLCNGMVTMQSMGMGGGFLMTIYIRENQTAYTLNAREKAPLNSKSDLYKNDPLTTRNGPLAIAVPGELKGYWTAHQRFGKLKWETLVQPTIDLCESGYIMSRHQSTFLKSTQRYPDPNFKEWFLDPKGNFKKQGSKIIPTKLCETLKLIAKNGANDFYNGTLSKILLEDFQAIKSIITKEDLESYKAEWMEPITVELKNKEILYSVPPPGSGALLGLILNILDGFNFTPESISDVGTTVQTYHRIIEAFKYAYAKRTEFGDTNFVNITNLLANLTSSDYADSIRRQISDNSTSNDPLDYGAVYYNKDDHGTAHISVLAENGDAVSVTSSVNFYFGSGLTSPQTGIILNSVMDDFSFPYFINYFGLPGSPNNELKPGKRPVSSMTPSILVDGNGDVKFVIGAAGGTKITTGVAMVLMRMLWFGQNIKEAVDAPRLHHQLYPMEIQYEYGTLQQVVAGLEKLGHKTSRFDNGGSVICALFKAVDRIFANADYRKGGDVHGID